MLIYDPMSNISKHFKMHEIGKSDIASRNGIDNTPTPIVLAAASTFANTILEPIREHFGVPFSLNSWYRGESLERFINDIPYKQWCARAGLPVSEASWKKYFAKKSHPKGEAGDLEIPGVSNDVLIEWIDKNIPVYDQLIREFPKPNDPTSGWVHVSFSATKNRRERFVIN
jgi:zinc D-Ala-D-Ala carboxypeptidase